ncbi:MAG TPA: hypothetical protein VFY23_14890 [Candidatus Limnocylindrales bacterium]|nr:hypothetical protein [Candidatus Limnocylindrales bacterium]
MPELLLVKLIATPLLVGGASIVARRWGPSIGGWIVSLPLTSGPILFFLALEAGPAFAAATTVGTLLGMGAICGFTVGYLAGSGRGPWVAMAFATAGFVGVSLAVQPVVAAPYVLLVIGVVAAVTLVLRLLPRERIGRSATPHPAWDLPARIIVGTTLVVGLTAAAERLGAIPSGLAATFPAYVSVLAVFAHLHDGRPAALGVLRGLLSGLFGTITFFVMLHTLLVPAGIVPAFAAAIAGALLVGGLGLRRVRARPVSAGLGRG